MFIYTRIKLPNNVVWLFLFDRDIPHIILVCCIEICIHIVRTQNYATVYFFIYGYLNRI